MKWADEAHLPLPSEWSMPDARSIGVTAVPVFNRVHPVGHLAEVKPRIFWSGEYRAWFCRSPERTRYGNTPEQAYYRWASLS